MDGSELALRSGIVVGHKLLDLFGNGLHLGDCDVIEDGARNA